MVIQIEIALGISCLGNFPICQTNKKETNLRKKEKTTGYGREIDNCESQGKTTVVDGEDVLR